MSGAIVPWQGGGDSKAGPTLTLTQTLFRTPDTDANPSHSPIRVRQEQGWRGGGGGGPQRSEGFSRVAPSIDTRPAGYSPHEEHEASPFV